MDLLQRLRKVEPDGEGERTRWYRNPDGLEAATEIERLRQKHKDMVSKLKWVVNEYNKLLNDHNELLKETTGGE